MKSTKPRARPKVLPRIKKSPEDHAWEVAWCVKNAHKIRGF